VRVTVETQSSRQIQEVHGGSSYQAANDLRLHFGLGANRDVKKLLIRWTTGKIQTFENVEGDKIYALREGEQLAVR
jgi:enediyne biosynthesis protein E4